MQQCQDMLDFKIDTPSDSELLKRFKEEQSIRAKELRHRIEYGGAILITDDVRVAPSKSIFRAPDSLTKNQAKRQRKKQRA